MVLIEYPETYASYVFRRPVMSPFMQNTGGFSSIIRTSGEFSVICQEVNLSPGKSAGRGWTLMGVQGPLDFFRSGDSV